jgi:hypothetical protein
LIPIGINLKLPKEYYFPSKLTASPGFEIYEIGIAKPIRKIDSVATGINIIFDDNSHACLLPPSYWKL